MQTPKLLREFKIPILPQDHQERIVDYMDKIFGSDHKKLYKLVSKFKDYDLFKILLNENYNGFDKLLELYDDIIYQEGFYKRYTIEYKNMLIQRCFKMVPSKEVKLGDVCEVKYGTLVTKAKDGIKEDYKGIKYDVYGGGGATYQTDKCNREKGTLIISRKGVSPHCIRIVNEDFFLNESGMSLKVKNINTNYLNYYLLSNQNHIFKYACGQAQKNMQTPKLLREFKIHVPTEEDQLKVIDMINDINKEESDFNKQVETIKIVIQELYDCVDLTVNYNNSYDEESNNDLEDDSKGGEHEDDEPEEYEPEESDNDSEDDSKDDEPEDDELEEYEIIEHKDKQYILQDNNVYRINDDETKGKLFGSYTNGKVKKIKTVENVSVV